MHRRLAVLLLASFAFSAVACQDIAGPTADIAPVADTLTARALNGTPFGSYSALDLYLSRVAAPDGSLSFDLVFDLDADGKPMLIPVSKIAICNRLCQVGLQVVNDSTFDQLTRARVRGFTYDTPITVAIGKPVYIVAKSYGCSGSIYSNDLYAKLVVDSVHTVDRSIFFRVVADPNCGFRGLVPGVTPKN